MAKFTLEISTVEALASILSAPGVSLTTLTSAPTREKAKTAPPLPSTHLIYDSAPGVTRPTINIKQSLAANNISLHEITSTKWRCGSWQNSLKRAISARNRA